MSSVFVVDDTLADRELVSLVLEASGYETVAFESSRKALEAVEQDAPDLVVLDLLMPELDGLDVVQELRAHASTRQQRILILTAHYKPEELAGLGLDPRCLVLAKPVLPHQLLAAVDAALDPGLPAVESLPAQLAARCARLRAGKPIVRELERREAELERAQRLDALGRLAPGIAHDFNNLLQVIGGYGAALRDRLGAAEAEEICKASARAAELTRQLLSFARRETAERRVLDANEVVADVATMLDRVIGEHVRLRIEADERGCGVLGDRAELEQVLVNLAVNARDAMARGGDLVVATSAGAGEVRLSVSDTGTGMDRDTLARAFEPFFTTKGPGRGTGLGLAIVARVAEQWGGRVEVVSAPGEGTTVTLVLPQVAVRPAPAEAPPERRSQGGTERVLLVEDEPAVRRYVGTLLERLGYAVTPAPNGAAALELARGAECPYDLVLTDLLMPGMTGRELVETLRAEGRVRAAVYMTGYAPGEDRLGGAFLEKPFTPESLALNVRGALDRIAPG